MNVAYCSIMFPDEEAILGKTKKKIPWVSLHKFTQSVVAGIDANSEKPVTLFSIANVLNYPTYPQLVFPTEKWQHTAGAHDWSIGYVNLFGLKYLTQEKKLHKLLKRWVREHKGEHNVICVHHIFYPAMKAACRIKSEFPADVHLTLITGDMPGRFGLKAQTGNGIKQRLTNSLEKKIENMVPLFDSFVFATEEMATAFEVTDKPCRVVECAYRDSRPFDDDDALTENDGKMVFYAGSLREEYGIKHLLNAFSLIEDADYKLVIAGAGMGEELVLAAAKKDPRIVPLGFITPQEVAQWQRKATILISPRTGEMDFVKYSFPSKTMECLASGKPYIAHKLPCEPPEYGKHIQYPEDETDFALAKKIIEVSELPQEERLRIGSDARRFIREEKNPTVMCKRIVEMWREVFAEEE